jgi:hypothetical protein
MNSLQVHRPALVALPENFVKAHTPGKCLMLFKGVDSARMCLQNQAPSLGMIKRQYGDDFIVAYLALWIDNLNDFVNAVRKMNPGQIEETAVILFQDYYYFNLADINLVFRKIKKGEYGQLFAELDGVKILGWFEQYARERAATAADLSIDQSAGFRQDLPRISNGSEQIKNRQAMGLHLLEQAKTKP